MWYHYPHPLFASGKVNGHSLHKYPYSESVFILYYMTTTRTSILTSDFFHTNTRQVVSAISSSLQVSYFFIRKVRGVESHSGLDTLNPLHHWLKLTGNLVLFSLSRIPWDFFQSYTELTNNCMDVSKLRVLSFREKQMVLTTLFVWLSWNQIIYRISWRNCCVYDTCACTITAPTVFVIVTMKNIPSDRPTCIVHINRYKAFRYKIKCIL